MIIAAINRSNKVFKLLLLFFKTQKSSFTERTEEDEQQIVEELDNNFLFIYETINRLIAAEFFSDAVAVTMATVAPAAA